MRTVAASASNCKQVAMSSGPRVSKLSAAKRKYRALEEKVLKLTSEGKSVADIAKQLCMTRGKVQYALVHPVSQRNPRGRPKGVFTSRDTENYSKKSSENLNPSKTEQSKGKSHAVVDTPQPFRVSDAEDLGATDDLRASSDKKPRLSVIPAGATNRGTRDARELSSDHAVVDTPRPYRVCDAENWDATNGLRTHAGKEVMRSPIPAGATNRSTLELFSEVGQKIPTVEQFERRLIKSYTKLMTSGKYVSTGVVVATANLLLEEMGVPATVTPDYLSCGWLVQYLERRDLVISDI